MKKTYSEIQDIFCLSRDDLRTLEKDGVLKPIKNGQGKASYFSDADLDKILNIKLYLLADYRIADMKKIMVPGYDLDSEVEKQIYLYKRRIKLLEFIRNLRADVLDILRLPLSQIKEFNTVSAGAFNMPRYGSDDYYYAAWNYLELIFRFDYLTREESIYSDAKYMLKRILTTYHAIQDILGVYVDAEDFEDITSLFMWMADATDEDDREAQEFIKEVVNEFTSQKDQLSEELMQSNIKQVAEALDSQSIEAYSKLLMHMSQFLVDYFSDERALYYLYLNIKRFVSECLDKTALAKGEIVIGGTK